MIEQNGSNRRESAKVIFVGRVIAMPRDDVERRMADLSDMEAAAPFYRQAASCFLLLVGRHRNFEVARIGERSGAIGPRAGKVNFAP